MDFINPFILFDEAYISFMNGKKVTTSQLLRKAETQILLFGF